MNREVKSIVASCLLTGLFVVNACGADKGMFEADIHPEKAAPPWRVLSGKAKESLKAGNWVVRSPNNFCRRILFKTVPRTTGQRNEVTVRWSASGLNNNNSADGFRIATQGRLLRLHPLDSSDGKDVLLTGTRRGMRPDIPESIVNLSDLPAFEASELNTFRIRWVTNDDDTYGFAVSINGHSIGTLPGEAWPAADPPSLAFEFRAGTHKIDFIRWHLHEGGERLDARPIALTRHAQLLLDDRLIAESSGLKRTLHQPQMHPQNPVLTHKEPWEYGAVLLWGTVIYDDQDKLFKMWYMTWGNDAGGALSGWRTPVCYATSKDGVHWERPKLNLYTFRYRDVENDGQIRERPVNNIVFNLQQSELGMDSPTVVKDLDETNPKFRYKMTYWHRLPTGTGIYQAHSADGVHWTHIPRIVANTGDRNTFHFDPFRKKWIIVSRPSGSFYELQKFGKFNRNVVRTAIDPEPRDYKKYPDCRMYSCPVVNYQGLQLAMPELYSLKLNRWITYLAWSDNGVRWTIDPQREPWMPWNAIPGKFDCWRRNIHNGGFIRRGDKLWVYFSGRSQGKNIPGKAGFLVPSGKPGSDPRGIVGSIGLATLRVDGFISRDASEKPGFLLTKPLTFQGRRLHINADIRPNGHIKAALLDAGNRPISGFSWRDCKPLTGDRIDHEVRWKNAKDLQPLIGKPVRLHLELKNANLYSFRFSD